jgi:hypothetical protein
MLGAAPASAAPVEEPAAPSAPAEEQLAQAEAAAERAEQAEASSEAADLSAYAAVKSKAELAFPGYARKIAKLRYLIAKKVARKQELRQLPLRSKRRKYFLHRRREAIEATRHRLNEVLRALRAKMAAKHA